MVIECDENDRLNDIVQRLVDFIRPMGSCAVAFSGGVDSAVVAQAAQVALGDRALAVTGVSPSLAAGELEIARRIAAEIGIRHRILETHETEIDDYRRNDARRCFHCKSNLYSEIAKLRSDEGFSAILSGTNKDDISDHRPGLSAAETFGVRHPLAECDIDKPMVRAVARRWNLEVWNKPATPCLASRIAYGVTVTDERLQKVDLAERFLRGLGFDSLRVRFHEGDLARIEVPVEQISRLAAEPARSAIIERLRDLGFRFVSLDLMGFRSGGLNALLPLVTTGARSASVEDFERSDRIDHYASKEILSHAKPSP